MLVEDERPGRGRAPRCLFPLSTVLTHLRSPSSIHPLGPEESTPGPPAHGSCEREGRRVGVQEPGGAAAGAHPIAQSPVEAVYTTLLCA